MQCAQVRPKLRNAKVVHKKKAKLKAATPPIIEYSVFKDDLGMLHPIIHANNPQEFQIILILLASPEGRSKFNTLQEQIAQEK